MDDQNQPSQDQFPNQFGYPRQYKASSRSQNNITWKPGHQAIFQTALDAWIRTAPKNAGAGDFIIDLLSRQRRNEAAEATDARLAALGIDGLIAMHRRRMDADTSMIVQIAEMIEDAQAKAREEVQAEISGLEKKAGFATQAAEEEKGRRIQAEDRVAVLSGELETAQRQLEDTLQSLEKNIQDRLREEKELDEAKARISDLGDSLDTSRRELDDARKEALDARAERDRIAIELEGKAQKLEAEAGRSADLMAKLEEAMRKLGDMGKAQEQEKARSAGLARELEEARAQLNEARVAQASLEATARAQAETIASLNGAIATLNRLPDNAQNPAQKSK